MAKIIICDLCGKPLNNRTPEHYKFKKYFGCFDFSGWSKIDIHEECRKKLFDAIELNSKETNEESENTQK